eukprot:scaffold244126_cov30-Tisochrysis_lutea.AAC.5
MCGTSNCCMSWQLLQQWPEVHSWRKEEWLGAVGDAWVRAINGDVGGAHGTDRIHPKCERWRVGAHS